MVQNRAKENISGEHGHIRHIQTGNLRRNIKSKVGWASTFELIGIIGTDVPYAAAVEFGTYKQTANPFMRKSLAGKKSKINEPV